MVEAPPALAFVVAQAQLLLELLIVSLDPPAQLGGVGRYSWVIVASPASWRASTCSARPCPQATRSGAVGSGRGFWINQLPHCPNSDPKEKGAPILPAHGIATRSSATSAEGHLRSAGGDLQMSHLGHSRPLAGARTRMPGSRRCQSQEGAIPGRLLPRRLLALAKLPGYPALHKGCPATALCRARRATHVHKP